MNQTDKILKLFEKQKSIKEKIDTTVFQISEESSEDEILESLSKKIKSNRQFYEISEQITLEILK